MTFCPPYNWCDRACERCPITGQCPLFRRQQQREWVHRARKEDPNDWDVVMADVVEDLGSALATLEEMAKEDGIDLDAPPPKVPVSLEAVRVEHAARALMHAVLRAERDALPLVTLLVAKVARVASFVLLKDDPDVWGGDAAPNLLLLERTRAALGAALTDVADEAAEDVTRTLADFDRALAPLLAAVGEEARAELEGLIARGEAPSPWCVLP